MASVPEQSEEQTSFHQEWGAKDNTNSQKTLHHMTCSRVIENLMLSVYEEIVKMRKSIFSSLLQLFKISRLDFKFNPNFEANSNAPTEYLMYQSSSKFVLTVVLALLTLQSLSADIISFATDDTAGFSVSGDTYTRQLTNLLVDGVTFDAQLTVTAFENDGSAGDFDVGSTGLGITTGGGSVLVHNGEYLGFSLATSNASGGTITFDGFTEIIFNSFGASDSGVLSIDDDPDSLGDNFFSTTSGAGTVDISATSPTSFFAISGNPGQNTFRVDGISAQFTGSLTAVPEPSSLFLMATASIGALCFRRRRS